MSRGFISHSGNRAPNLPYALNQDSPLARGLYHFWTAAPGGYIDLVHGVNAPRTSSATSVIAPIMGQTINPNNALYDVPNAKVATASGQPFTMAALITSSGTGNRTFLSFGTSSNNQGPHFGVFNSLWNFGIWGGENITGGTPTDMLPTWMVATYDGTNGRIYVDGVLKGGPSTYTFTGSDSSVRISGLNNASQWFWDEPIKHVAIANRAWSDAEVYGFFAPPTRWDLYQELGRKIYFVPAPAPSGRIMSSLAHHGGLAGPGGIAGVGGGLAG